MRVHLTIKSANKKVGPIPVSTTESSSCPTSCPFYSKGCYAKTGPLAIHWRKLDEGDRGVSWEEFVNAIENLPEGQIWRHNQAGDLPGKDDRIDIDKLNRLVDANRGRRGFTYTHKPLKTEEERQAVKNANDNGFVVNLSANNLDHADELLELNIGPVCVVLPDNNEKRTYTPKGNLVVVCPATYRDTNCQNCRLCAKKDRNFVVGFPAHGTHKKTVEEIVGR